MIKIKNINFAISRYLLYSSTVYKHEDSSESLTKMFCEAYNKLLIDYLEFIFCLYDMSHNLKLNTEMSNSLRQSKLLNMLPILTLNIKINVFFNVRCIKK